MRKSVCSISAYDEQKSPWENNREKPLHDGAFGDRQDDSAKGCQGPYPLKNVTQTLPKTKKAPREYL